jgi:hypothetical protein
MKSLENKLIIYDSNCKVCSSLRKVVVRFTSIPDRKIMAYKDLSPELSSRVDAGKFRNVMALIDTADGRTIYGAEGIAYIFSCQYKIIDFLLSFRPVFHLFTFLYKTQAYNRYIIATPKSLFRCDCSPDRVIKYRISYIAMTLIFSILLTALFGNSLRQLLPGNTSLDAPLRMLLMAGTGWILQIGLATSILRAKALDYIGHLGSIMVVGLLILVPWIILQAGTGISNAWLPAVSVLISSTYMLHLHIHRVRHLELSQWWTVSWFVLLQSTAFFWIHFFYLK